MDHMTPEINDTEINEQLLLIFTDFFQNKYFCLHSVSEHKKRHIRNYTQILENLRNAIVGFFWSKKRIFECPRE